MILKFSLCYDFCAGEKLETPGSCQNFVSSLGRNAATCAILHIGSLHGHILNKNSVPAAFCVISCNNSNNRLSSHAASHFSAPRCSVLRCSHRSYIHTRTSFIGPARITLRRTVYRCCCCCCFADRFVI